MVYKFKWYIVYTANWGIICHLPPLREPEKSIDYMFCQDISIVTVRRVTGNIAIQIVYARATWHPSAGHMTWNCSKEHLHVPKTSTAAEQDASNDDCFPLGWSLFTGATVIFSKFRWCGSILCHT